jgi:hypothetical protein
MLFLHLYDADDNWVGQFRNVEGIEAYLLDLGKTIDAYTIKQGPTKYPPA